MDASPAPLQDDFLDETIRLCGVDDWEAGLPSTRAARRDRPLTFLADRCTNAAAAAYATCVSLVIALAT
jgi:hypothetical protein